MSDSAKLGTKGVNGMTSFSQQAANLIINFSVKCMILHTLK